jgi:hypothetical protein
MGVGLPVFPLLSLARAKNSIHAVFRLRFFASQKPRNLLTPASMPLRLLRKQLAAPAHGIHAIFGLWVCFANPGDLFKPASMPLRLLRRQFPCFLLGLFEASISKLEVLPFSL